MTKNSLLAQRRDKRILSLPKLRILQDLPGQHDAQEHINKMWIKVLGTLSYFHC